MKARPSKLTLVKQVIAPLTPEQTTVIIGGSPITSKTGRKTVKTRI